MNISREICSKDIFAFLTKKGICWDFTQKEDCYYKDVNILGKKYNASDLSLYVNLRTFIISEVDCYICYEDTEYYSTEIVDFSTEWIRFLYSNNPALREKIRQSVAKEQSSIKKEYEDSNARCLLKLLEIKAEKSKAKKDYSKKLNDSQRLLSYFGEIDKGDENAIST